jgi:hypothetical protein
LIARNPGLRVLRGRSTGILVLDTVGPGRTLKEGALGQSRTIQWTFLARSRPNFQHQGGKTGGPLTTSWQAQVMACSVEGVHFYDGDTGGVVHAADDRRVVRGSKRAHNRRFQVIRWPDRWLACSGYRPSYRSFPRYRH